MTIRSKSVDKAFKLIRDGITDSGEYVKNHKVHADIKQIYRLKIRILLDIRESFDEYVTNLEPFIEDKRSCTDIFPGYIDGEIKAYESCIGDNSERLILNTLYQFRIELMKRLLEKYDKLV